MFQLFPSSCQYLISWDHLEGRGSQERRATKANQDVPLTALDPQASVGALGPRALLDGKDHVSAGWNGCIYDTCDFISSHVPSNVFLLPGEEFFKGAPGGRGRPGSAGSKGTKGAESLYSCY